jgi:hypothetical protein
MSVPAGNDAPGMLLPSHPCHTNPSTFEPQTASQRRVCIRATVTLIKKLREGQPYPRQKVWKGPEPHAIATAPARSAPNRDNPTLRSNRTDGPCARRDSRHTASALHNPPLRERICSSSSCAASTHSASPSQASRAPSPSATTAATWPATSSSRTRGLPFAGSCVFPLLFYFGRGKGKNLTRPLVK